MIELLITRGVIRTIETECLRNPHTETGGMLLGTMERYIAISATTAGQDAVKTATSYFNDEKYDHHILQETVRKYDGHVKSIGFWHKHPAGLRHPSMGDLAEACRVVNSISPEGDNRPVFFMIAILSRSLDLFAYVLNHNMIAFDEVRLRIIDDDAREVREALAQEPVIIQPHDLDFWGDPDFQWFQTNTGYARLKKDIDELTKRNYRARAFAGKMLYLTIEKDGKTITCITPPEYPLNPPRLFENNLEIPIVLTSWNSTFMIVDVLTLLEKERNKERRNCEDNHSKTGHLSRILNSIKKTVKSVWPFAGGRRD